MVASYLDGYGKPLFYYGEEKCQPINVFRDTRCEILDRDAYDSYSEIDLHKTIAGKSLDSAAESYLTRTTLKASRLITNLAFEELGKKINLRVIPGERQVYWHSGCHTGTEFDDGFGVFNEPQTVFQEAECPDSIEKECDNCWKKIARMLIEAKPLNPKGSITDKKKNEYYNGYKAIERFLDIALKNS